MATYSSSFTRLGTLELVVLKTTCLTPYRCGHCKKLAPIWTELARNMRGKLTIAEVNCEEQGALCRSQGVTGYPMLYYYPSGKDTKMEYTGGRKLEQLIAFAEKLSGP